MQKEQTTIALREKRLAWDILRNSTTMRMLGVRPGSYRARPTREGLESVRLVRHIADEALEGDLGYFRARSEEEHDATATAKGSAARKAHEDLADLHRQVAQAIALGASRMDPSIERREALLDDALDDTFPASDPPAMVMPRRLEPTH